MQSIHLYAYCLALKQHMSTWVKATVLFLQCPCTILYEWHFNQLAGSITNTFHFMHM